MLKIFRVLNFRCVEFSLSGPSTKIKHFEKKFTRNMEEYGRALCVRGYHVYCELWEAAVGEVLMCERELRNAKDRHAVAVKKDGTVIGHLYTEKGFAYLFALPAERRKHSLYCNWKTKVFY